jgi:uncharacterized phage infection (PIP) family protein YhgE
MTTMSKIQELKKKLESIPAKQSRKNLVSKLDQYAKITEAASTMIQMCASAKQYAQQVFGDEEFQKVSDHTRKAVNTAKRLRDKLTDKVEAVEKSDAQFRDISDAAKSAQAALRDRWNFLLNKKVEEFERIVRAAKDANLGGSRALEQTLHRLSGQINNPPQSGDVAQRIEQDLKGLVNSVQTLGLEGPAGQFLVEAAAGRGRAKDLSNPEIIKFIERYNLWNSLNVRLG